jgi:hypothetical protein
VSTDRTHLPSPAGFYLVLSPEDLALLDALAGRYGISRARTISGALHLLEATRLREQIERHPDNPDAGEESAG